MKTLPLLSLALCCACATSGPGRDDLERGLHFIEDDYPAALKEARARGVPLFVDAWAPWCHSCVFLKEHVFTSPQLAPQSRRYVFLSIDTEKEKNAAFLEKYPVEVWPSLFVVDPTLETAALKWLGIGTVEQLQTLLDDGLRAVSDATAKDKGLEALAQADRRYARGEPSAEAYQKAVEALGLQHPRAPRAVESLLNALYGAHDFEACAKAGVTYAPKLPEGPSLANAVALSLSCATSADAAAPFRAGAIEVLEPLAVRALKLEGILADDKSGLYELLVGLHEERKEPALAQALALEWLTFLEGEAQRAPTPKARAVFDPHRVNAALAAKVPLRAEQALLLSEKELPFDYNPPARLALVYREAGRFDDALAAVGRAFAKAYGPRKLRLYETKASVLARQGDLEGQRATLQEAVAYGRALPDAQRPQRTLKRLQAELDKLAR